jgi:G3E family GTPase
VPVGVPVPVTVLHGDTGEIAALYRSSGAHVSDTVAVLGERTPDCPCCQARLDVVDALGTLVDRRTPPTSIVLAVAAVDDAATVVQTILSDPDLQRLVALDGVVASLDGIALATRLALGEPLLTPQEAIGVGIADRVALRRGGDLTDAAQASIDAMVFSANRLARRFVGSDPLAAWHGVPCLDTVTDIDATSVDATSVETASLTTVMCVADAPLDPEAIDAWLASVVARHGVRLLRLQGALAVRGHDDRVCCRAVRSCASSHSEGLPGHVRSTSSMVAVVGFDLDAEDLRSGFLATVA